MKRKMLFALLLVLPLAAFTGCKEQEEIQNIPHAAR